MADAETGPVPRTCIIRIAVWANCVLLCVGGLISVITGFITAVFQPTSFVMSIYMCLFGAIALVGEMDLAVSRRYFGFFHDWIGEAVFFIFVGTLGIGQSTSSIAAFVVGIISCVVGVVCILDHFMCSKKLFLRQSSAPGQTTVAAEPSH